MDHAPDTSDHLADLNLDPNEASGLVRVDDQRLLERRGWDRAFWSVLDEVDIADGLALLGHRSGGDLARDWEVERVACRRIGDAGPADDAEAIARKGDWVYAFGSQHGGKQGPIRLREQWVARFREAGVTPQGDDGAEPAVELDVVHTEFRLHRILNDSLRDGDLDVIAFHPASREAFITKTIAELAGTDAAGRVRDTDWTVNVEGAEFTPTGALLLGLRFPVTADGCPIVVQLDGVERMFAERRGWPEVTALWAIDAPVRGGDLAGVRDLCLHDDRLHVVVGDLDSAGKQSVLREDYPQGRDTVTTHVEARLDPAAQGGRLSARLVREFPEHPRIEGIAADGEGSFFYVSDEDEAVHLRCTPLLGG
ncbi:hypothetical protein BH20ACT8_BH20ACT8_16550 [soil metagenome]